MAKRWSFQFVPLKASFMAMAIFGILITAYIVRPMNQNYAIALMLVFFAMFIASLISMTKAPITNA
tara:strand:+ start:185 stop:382 length:198 start_codon:yes stop_codon:yes gene_type:complete